MARRKDERISLFRSYAVECTFGAFIFFQKRLTPRKFTYLFRRDLVGRSIFEGDCTQTVCGRNRLRLPSVILASVVTRFYLGAELLGALLALSFGLLFINQPRHVVGLSSALENTQAVMQVETFVSRFRSPRPSTVSRAFDVSGFTDAQKSEATVGGLSFPMFDKPS